MKTEIKTYDGLVWDVAVFSVSIHQKEGLKALCDLEIASGLSDVVPDYLEVWIDDVFQFKGCVSGVLQHFTPYTMRVELTSALTLSSRTSVEGAQSRDLFFSQEYFATANEHLPHIYHYDRITGNLEECHVLHAPKTLAVSADQILHYQSTNQPVPTGVDLVLEAKWRWQKTEYFDLWAAIKAQTGGVFATLTPESFIKKWEKSLQINQQSGYRIIHNKLFVEKPRYSSPVDKKRIKGGIVDGQCIVEARQEQKCHEIIHYSIGDFPKRKRLSLKVPISEHDQTVFFETDTGQAWLNRAQAIAYNHFLATNRQKRVIFDIVFSAQEMAQLTLNAALVWNDTAWRITEYALTNKGEGYVCRVAVCTLHDACDFHYDKAPCCAGVGITAEGDRGPTSFIQDLHIMNHFDQQNAHVLSAQSPPTRLPATAVYIQLKDLRPLKIQPKILRLATN